MDDRIKLADAMGWAESETGWRRPSREGFWHPTDESLPDPFIDANDDYAVLEWMRNKVLAENALEADWDNWEWFMSHLHNVTNHDIVPDYYSEATSYVVGDYARAALKVINND